MIGIFGGTFNPIHWGHIRTAVELKKALDIERMILVPCGLPPHREAPSVDAQTRLAMVQAAIKNEPALLVDSRELGRQGPSYTVDTLTEIRRQHNDVPICLIVGADAFLQFDSWHRWRHISELAHIIVVHRPGWPITELLQRVSPQLREFVLPRCTTTLTKIKHCAAGLILMQKITEIDISSSGIRTKIAQGESIARLVPQAVQQIIEQNALYKN